MQIHVDNALCTGCRTCQIACSLAHFDVNNPKKSALRIEARFPDPGEYRIRMCNQCGTCAEVCPEEAIFKDGDRYLIDAAKCTLCEACVNACPQGVLPTHRDIGLPIACDLCFRCVEACAYNALSLRDGGI